jgi:hypothetical protein
LIAIRSRRALVGRGRIRGEEVIIRAEINHKAAFFNIDKAAGLGEGKRIREAWSVRRGAKNANEV